MYAWCICMNAVWHKPVGCGEREQSFDRNNINGTTIWSLFPEVAETGHKSFILIAYEHLHFDETEYVNIRYKFENQHFGAKISVHLVEIFVAFHLKIWFRFINHSRMTMYHDTWCCCGHIGDTTTTKWIIQASVENIWHTSLSTNSYSITHRIFKFWIHFWNLYDFTSFEILHIKRSARNQMQLIPFNCYKNVLI